MRRICVAAVLAAAGFMWGCASERPLESEALRAERPMEAVQLSGVAGASAQANNRGTQTILAISGGGADGAFGAGVLNGWSESGRRPKFDIVTGVSTGGFMAAMVFAGPTYDTLLRRLYTSYDSTQIYEDKGLAGLSTESLFSEAPLRRLIERFVTKKFVDDVAAEHAAGRRLYIATTNLDSGELVVWDMGRIASGNRDDPVLMFQKVLRASAAIPGFFPPVYIKPQKGNEARQAHVDGGVKAPVLIQNFMFEAPARERSLYVIMNGSLSRLNANQAVKASVTEIGKKSITELMRSLTDASLYQGYVAARNSGSHFRLLAIPDSVPASASALDFNKVTMRRLYEAGHRLGLEADPWAREPPGLERFNKVVGPSTPPKPAEQPLLAAKPETGKGDAGQSSGPFGARMAESGP